MFQEAQAIFNSLGIIENILEFKPELSFDISSSQGLMTWLLKRLKLKTGGDPAVKSYASEILAILLQNSDEVSQFSLSLHALCFASVFKILFGKNIRREF